MPRWQPQFLQCPAFGNDRSAFCLSASPPGDFLEIVQTLWTLHIEEAPPSWWPVVTGLGTRVGCA